MTKLLGKDTGGKTGIATLAFADLARDGWIRKMSKRTGDANTPLALWRHIYPVNGFRGRVSQVRILPGPPSFNPEVPGFASSSRGPLRDPLDLNCTIRRARLRSFRGEGCSYANEGFRAVCPNVYPSSL